VESAYLQNLGFSIIPRPLVNCTALVIWGSPDSLGSSVGLSIKFNSIIDISPYQKGEKTGGF